MKISLRLIATIAWVGIGSLVEAQVSQPTKPVGSAARVFSATPQHDNAHRPKAAQPEEIAPNTTGRMIGNGGGQPESGQLVFRGTAVLEGYLSPAGLEVAGGGVEGQGPDGKVAVPGNAAAAGGGQPGQFFFRGTARIEGSVQLNGNGTLQLGIPGLSGINGFVVPVTGITPLAPNGKLPSAMGAQDNHVVFPDFLSPSGPRGTGVRMATPVAPLADQSPATTPDAVKRDQPPQPPDAIQPPDLQHSNAAQPTAMQPSAPAGPGTLSPQPAARSRGVRMATPVAEQPDFTGQRR